MSAGFFTPTITLDAKLDLLEQAPRGLKTGSRIRFYHTTQEAVGRISVLGAQSIGPGESAFVQLRFDRPVVVQLGDRYILRFYSPMETLGGGTVLDPHPRRHKQKTIQESLSALTVFEQGTTAERLERLISAKGLAGIEEASVFGMLATDKQDIVVALSALAQKKTILRIDSLFVHTAHLALLEKNILDLITQYHKNNPLKTGLDKEEMKGMLRIRLHTKILVVTIDGLVKKKQLEAEGSKLRLPGFTAAFDQGPIKDRIVAAIIKGGTQPPVREELPALFNITDKDARDLLKLLADDGRLIRINDSLYLDRTIVDKIRMDLKTYLETKKEVTMAEFRDLAKTSRKFAVPIMEYFDSQRLTQRVGDKRVLRG